jgi:hypothetical protein
MRFVLLAILIQFAVPLFVSATALTDSQVNSHTTRYESAHNSLLIPQLIKEKEEGEDRADHFFIDFVTLIDFKNLNAVLTSFHSFRIKPFIFQNRYDHHPPLFTLHHAFLV